MEENAESSSGTERDECDRNEETNRWSRRRLLGGLTAGLSLLAGCSALTGDGTTDSASSPTQLATTTIGRTSESATGTGTPTTTTPPPTPTEESTPSQPQPSTPTASPRPPTTPASTRTSPTTATPAVSATPTGTSSSASTQEVVSISPNDLTTFSDSRIAYTIEYPAEWSASVRSVDDPSWVAMKPSSSVYSGYTDINIYGYSELPFSPSTREAFAAWFTELFKGTYDDLTVERRRTLTLSDGTQARELYVSARRSNSPDLRERWLFAIVNSVGYAVEVRLLAQAYTSTVTRAVDAIINSFTVGTDSQNARFSRFL